uniref:F-box protein n=1 Tax=Noccaea caerulescens TaxID=107243 RepID=A0A1J3E1B2_NOCCA
MIQSTLKRSLDFPDPDPDSQRAKAPRSTLNLRPKSGSPLLMLSLEEVGCRLYSPGEDMIYETKSDFSGYRFLANSGKWFLAVDSRSKLVIVDVFSEERIDLPPLESIKGGRCKFEVAGDQKFNVRLINDTVFFSSAMVEDVEDLRGLLWVDDKNGDYVVVWQFECSEFVGYCKKGDDHYREINTRKGPRLELQGLCDMVLKGYSLYVLTKRDFIRHLDLSGGQDGFKDVSENHRLPMWTPCLSTKEEYERLRAIKLISSTNSIAVTTSGEVLYVRSNAYETSTLERPRTFRVFKRDPKDLHPSTYDTRLVEVDSLGDEALILDLGFTVKVGIEPNSIYFTRGDRILHNKVSCLDMCVYNLATKTIKRFPGLSNLKVKDAQWFLPS